MFCSLYRLLGLKVASYRLMGLKVAGLGLSFEVWACSFFSQNVKFGFLTCFVKEIALACFG